MKRLCSTGLFVFILSWAWQSFAQCPLSATLTTNAACPGMGDGEIFIQMNSGVPPYSVFLNNSTTPTFTSGNTQTSFSISKLKAGTYAVRIVDSKTCSYQNTAVTVGTAAVPTVTISTVGAVCTGTSFTVKATLSQILSTSYTYAWSNGKAGSSFTDAISVTTRYVVTVTDANGCLITDDISVSPTPAPSLVMPGTTQICKG
ncbi:MAG: hypothetical protein ACKOA4_10095, partial [Haliscomenobacter sp.]